MRDIEYTGSAVENLIKRDYGDVEIKELLIEANLRLKQLVALKAIETIDEGRQLFFDDDLANEDFDRAVKIERQQNEPARESFVNQFNYADECIDDLLDARFSDDLAKLEAKKAKKGEKQ